MSQGKDLKASIQNFGGKLAGMIMPNMGAFIAWGLITALFIDTGWAPNEQLSTLVDPMINYLLPLLIAYTGGKMVHDVRGGVVGATAAMGLIVGSSMPMFLGAMIIGPVGGYLIKKVDQVLEGKVKSGFEMLVNNFSTGILSAILVCISFFFIGPIVAGISTLLATGVGLIVNLGVLPLISIFVEPAKVLFLNNAINHGVLGPIGIEQAAETGKSIMFLIESNPGPGLGILLAFMFFAKGASQKTASGAAIIHFFGGIHEIYFPYILMKPALLLAAIAGGATGVLTFGLLNIGLVATPSPGSVFALLALAPKGDHLGVLLGILAAAVVSFLVAAVILKASKNTGEENLEEATKKMEEMKGKKSSISDALTGEGAATTATTATTATKVSKMYFACDAGMGSSAMGASILRNKFKEAGIEIEVTNIAINNLTEDVELVITNHALVERAKTKAPKARFVEVKNFLSAPQYDLLVEEFKEN